VSWLVAYLAIAALATVLITAHGELAGIEPGAHNVWVPLVWPSVLLLVILGLIVGTLAVGVRDRLEERRRSST
jgi:uncharacterized membrane protein YhaH (DUF805 family)